MHVRPPTLGAGAPLVKGMAFVDIVKMGRKRRDEFFAALPDGSRALVEQRILASSWYPEELLRDVLVAYDRVFGRGDLRTIVPLARVGGKLAMTGVHRTFRELDPADTAARMQEIYKRYHTTGAVRVLRKEARRLEVVIEGAGFPNEPLCRANDGYFLGMLDVAGARGPRVTHGSCAARGEPFCSFDITWSLSQET